jgi:hypothetical protein
MSAPVPADETSRITAALTSRWMAWAHWGALLVSLAVMVRASSDFGITWDEPLMRDYGEWAYRFFASWGKDFRVFEHSDVYLYGGLFDLTCTIVGKVVPMDTWTLRHIVNSAAGWLGIFFAARLAKREFGALAGVLTTVFLVTSPRYFGHSMNNPKDVPFAALYVASLYYLLPVIRSLPLVHYRALLKLVVASALALNTRVGGLLPMAYLGLFTSIALVREPWDDLRKPLALASTVGAAVCIFLVLGSLAWPWSLGAPIVRPFVGLSAMSNFSWTGKMLFAGQSVLSKALPWNYLPQWLLISAAPAVVIGLVLAFFAFRDERRLGNAAKLLAFFGLFPVAYAIVRRVTLYDAERHFLFVYPPLVALAAGAWATFFAKQAKRPAIAAGLAVAASIAVAEPVAYSVRAHPNEYVYFNPLVGGISGAYNRYELDYWGNCVREAMHWVSEHRGAARPTLVGTNRGIAYDYVEGDASYQAVDGRSGHFYVHNVRYDGVDERDNAKLDGNVLHLVQADGVPLCLVKKGQLYAP